MFLNHLWQWEKEHEGMTCDEYGAWLTENNDPEIQLTKHLADHGVTCPCCNERYLLLLCTAYKCETTV